MGRSAIRCAQPASPRRRAAASADVRSLETAPMSIPSCPGRNNTGRNGLSVAGRGSDAKSDPNPQLLPESCATGAPDSRLPDRLGPVHRMLSRSRIAAWRVAAGLAALLAAADIRPAAAEPKHLAPIPAATLALMAARNTTAASPILIRAYKKESELEIWKQARDGRYVHLKTFPICRWSGQLGPKVRQGDRQVPEGFYTITPKQMNPNSAYYLSFDIGYPNAYDRAHGGTGAYLMVHGTCSSAGCFAMTDKAIGEIYAIARDALAGGQPAFQFQSYPFRMTAENMARHRSDPNIAFWRQLKEGSDRFEATREELAVGDAAGRYAFGPAKDPAKEAQAKARIADETARIEALVRDGGGAVRT